MRRFLLAITFSFFLFGVFSPVVNHFAINSIDSGWGVETAWAQSDDPPANPQEASKQIDNISNSKNESDNCDWYDLFCYGQKLVALLVASIVYAMLQVSGWILWAAGWILETSLDITVVNMRTWINHSVGIEIAWTTIRDFTNLGFIFILLVVAIKTILGLNDDRTKRMLINVVIVGLLINFSLFFTKFVIDTSNIVAIHFYNKASLEQTVSDISIGDEGLKAVGISANLLKPLGVTSVFDAGNSISDLQKIIDWKTFSGFGTILILGIMGSIFLVTSAFVLFAMAMMFILRFIVLIILMILSPLAFAAHILPATSKYASSWWDALIKESFYAPIQIILLYVVILVLNKGGLQNGGGLGAFIKGGPGGGGDVGLVISFIIVLFLISASLVVAKKMGAHGASGAVNIGTKLRKGAQSKIMANTAGRAAAGLDNWMGKTRLGNTWAGSAFRNITTGAAANAKWGGKTSGKDVIKSGLNRKAAYAKAKAGAKQKRAEKEEERRKKAQQKVDEVNEKVESSPGVQHAQKKIDAINSEISDLEKDTGNHDQVLEDLNKFENLQTTPDAQMSEQMKNEMAQLQEKLNTLGLTDPNDIRQIEDIKQKAEDSKKLNEKKKKDLENQKKHKQKYQATQRKKVRKKHHDEIKAARFDNLRARKRAKEQAKKAVDADKKSKEAQKRASGSSKDKAKAYFEDLKKQGVLDEEFFNKPDSGSEGGSKDEGSEEKKEGS